MFEPSCSPGVLITLGVLATIHFDHEMPLKRHEVHDVSADRRLSLELHLLKAMRTKEIPKPSFSLGHIGTKSLA
jgi:hypothetical protein